MRLCRHCGERVRTVVGNNKVWVHVDSDGRLCKISFPHGSDMRVQHFANPIDAGVALMKEEEKFLEGYPRCDNCLERLVPRPGEHNVMVHIHDGLVACGGGPMNILVGAAGAKPTDAVVLWEESQ